MREEAVRRRSRLGENFCQDHRGKVGNKKGKRFLPCVEKAGDALQCLFGDILSSLWRVVYKTGLTSQLPCRGQGRSQGQGVGGKKNCLNPDGKKN